MTARLAAHACSCYTAIYACKRDYVLLDVCVGRAGVSRSIMKSVMQQRIARLPLSALARVEPRGAPPPSVRLAKTRCVLGAKLAAALCSSSRLVRRLLGDPKADFLRKKEDGSMAEDTLLRGFSRMLEVVDVDPSTE